MASKSLFTTLRGALIPQTNTVNSHGAPAYALQPKQALAQYAATGCFGRTFYATAGEQLTQVLALCDALPPRYVAQVAIYSRTRSLMKDMPALLCAWLSHRDTRLHEVVFHQVIDNARMLRSYVQILRSGVVGRKSLGSAPKRLVREWLASRSPEALFRAGVGQNPSLADIVKMVHPRPDNEQRQAFYGYLLGRGHAAAALPALITQFEQFQAGQSKQAPDVPLSMLTALPLTGAHWVEIAKNASWQTLRMNLNTFARHGVYSHDGMPGRIAKRLRDAAEVKRARVFPYQLLTAYQHCTHAVPQEVRESLHEAMEIATANVPRVKGDVVVCPDVSGSMSSPVTGHRKGASSKVRCIDVAALVAATIMRRNPSARVLPFEQNVVSVRLSPSDSIMANAAALAAIGGGGTNCSAPLRQLNEAKAKADLVVLVSDNESWVDSGRGRGTALMAEWSAFRRRNPQARLVCLDIQPNETTQAAERADILNIGGFADSVFEVIAAFARGEMEADHWVERIEATAA